MNLNESSPWWKKLIIDKLKTTTQQLIFLLDNMPEIINTSDASQLDTRNVLEPADPSHHDVVLLQVVAFARHVGDRFLAAGQPDQNALPVGRVWLLGLLDDRTNDYGLGKSDVVPERVFVGSVRKIFLIALKDDINYKHYLCMELV